MAEISQHRPVLLLLAAFSRNDKTLDWARERASQHWGPIELEIARFVHDETTYYSASMGTDLKKTFFAFKGLIDPAELPELKIQAYDWEQEYAGLGNYQEQRPLNLDPGYLTEAKLVLATAKDRDHRIYLKKGIYAEVTLFYRSGAWQKRPWTYPDYQRADYHEFFTRCREYLRQQLRQTPGSNP